MASPQPPVLPMQFGLSGPWQFGPSVDDGRQQHDSSTGAQRSVQPEVSEGAAEANPSQAQSAPVDLGQTDDAPAPIVLASTIKAVKADVNRAVAASVPGMECNSEDWERFTRCLYSISDSTAGNSSNSCA